MYPCVTKVLKISAIFLKIFYCPFRLQRIVSAEKSRGQSADCDPVKKDEMEHIKGEILAADMLVFVTPLYYYGISGQLKWVIDRFYSAAYPQKPEKLKKVAMILSSGDADMYDGALFSFKGDFLDYLGLENMGVFTSHGSENGSREKAEELRVFGASLK